MRSISVALLLAAAPTLAAAETFRIGDRDVPALVRALQTANQSPGPHRIELHPGGIYTLELTDSAGLGLPALRSRITLAGNGAEIRRYSNARMTLLEVAEGGDAVIEDLTLAEGSYGALRNRGTLRLDGVAITDSGNDGAQGIVLNYGKLALHDCLVGYNQVHKAGRDAGIIYNLGTLELKHSRFVGNTLTRRSADPAAAAVLNQGELKAVEVEFVANAIEDAFDGLAFAAVLNLDNGRASGLKPGQILDENAPY